MSEAFLARASVVTLRGSHACAVRYHQKTVSISWLHSDSRIMVHIAAPLYMETSVGHEATHESLQCTTLVSTYNGVSNVNHYPASLCSHEILTVILIITHRTRVAETTGEDRIRFLITHNGGAYFHQVAVENVFFLSLDSSANDDSFEITTLFFFFSAHD